MSAADDPQDAPPAAPSPGSAPARPVGGARRQPAAARTDMVRLVGPDPQLAAAMERTRLRLLVTAGMFALLFGAAGGKLTWATIIHPMRPPPPRPVVVPDPDSETTADTPTKMAHGRANIVDRNGQMLAVSLPTAELYANPSEMIDTDEVAHQLNTAVPRLDEKLMAARLRSTAQFVTLARRLSSEEEGVITALAIPGISFRSPQLREDAPAGETPAADEVAGDADNQAPSTADLDANPRLISDPDLVAHKLKTAVPRLDEAQIAARLRAPPQFVYLARRLAPAEELAINALGIPGVSFQPSERRHYPQGSVAAQVLGGVDVDEHGVAGVEKFFNKRLQDNSEPLRLSLDIRVQAVVHDELAHAMGEFQAIGACGIVMDVRTGEIIAMVSLPDYDANDFGHAPPDARFNRAVTGMYEPGSTFKLQTAAMALDSGAAQLWNTFDAAHPIHIGRFTITDFEGKHRFLTLPEVLAYSSNLGAAHIAMVVGATRQRAWLEQMGMFRRIGVELPEAGQPLHPPADKWGEAAVMTVGFGHGIAVSPLHVVRGTSTLANGGVVLRPTLLQADEPDATASGTRVMQLATSDTMRKLMRLVVTDGYGKPADVPGYFVGGKTGTAEKIGRGGYKKHTNVSAFISVFPMNAPRYAVYMMLDEPHGNASTGGFSTAGAVSAPAAGRVIARIAPMLGMFPQLDDAAAIQASLYMPLQPGHGPIHAPAAATASTVRAPLPAAAPAPAALPSAAVPHDQRHQAALPGEQPVVGQPASQVAAR